MIGPDSLHWITHWSRERRRVCFILSLMNDFKEEVVVSNKFFIKCKRD